MSTHTHKKTRFSIATGPNTKEDRSIMSKQGAEEEEDDGCPTTAAQLYICIVHN